MDWKKLGQKALKWLGRKAAEEAQAELDKRLGSKTTGQSDTNPSSMTRPDR